MIKIDDIRAVLRDTMGLPADKIDLDSNFFDLGLDSLEYMDMLFELEGRQPKALPWSELEITPENAPQTVGQLLERLNGAGT